ncbi:hypothetical protein ACQP10_37860 (plasmid) [Streptosporangium sandarakinum]|uniref:hypothetical protein n=1 Tax=Streptosporangium sandarakinum TaxID=1260955 RepID=UPI003D8BB858
MSTATTIESIRAAHERAVVLQGRRKTEAAPRNLAGIVLIRRHHLDALDVYELMGVSRTMGDQEILAHAPVDELLPEMDEQQARAIIAEQRTALDTVVTEQEQQVAARRTAITRLAVGDVDGRQWKPGEIAKATGLTIQQVKADMWRTVAQVADLVSSTTTRVQDALDTAARDGKEIPPHMGEPALYDPAAFKTWWEEGRYGWLSAFALSSDLGADWAEVQELLSIAEEIGDLPEHEDVDGTRLFEPKAFRAWVRNRQDDEAEITSGWAGATALAYELQVPTLRLLGLLTAAKKTRTVPRHKAGRRGRLYEVDAFRQWWAARSGPAAVDEGWLPLGKVADQIGEPEHAVTAWVKDAEQRGIPLAPNRPGARGRLFDVAAFPAWWQETRTRTRGGTLATVAELAGLAGVDVKAITRGLAFAEKHAIELPPYEDDAEHGRQFAVEPFTIWWVCLAAAMAPGEPRFFGVTELATVVDQPVDKVKRQIKAAGERGRVLPPHRLNARGHREFEAEAYKAWRNLIER